MTFTYRDNYDGKPEPKLFKILKERTWVGQAIQYTANSLRHALTNKIKSEPNAEKRAVKVDATLMASRGVGYLGQYVQVLGTFAAGLSLGLAAPWLLFGVVSTSLLTYGAAGLGAAVVGDVLRAGGEWAAKDMEAVQALDKEGAKGKAKIYKLSKVRPEAGVPLQSATLKATATNFNKASMATGGNAAIKKIISTPRPWKTFLQMKKPFN